MNDCPALGRRSLTVDDILDLRAYERIRGGYRHRVMAAKRLRRVPLGPIMTVVFESVDTVRFQVHEMARVEKIVSDEGIQAELDVYNMLLPSPGELSATLFIELTSEDDLRRWLPELVGIESRLTLVGAAGTGPAFSVPSVPEAGHAETLTRESMTPAVHYLRFLFTEDQVRDFPGASQVALSADHAAYQARTVLSPETRAVLRGDLEGTTVALPYQDG